MITVGLTGGICSGKSVVLNIFQEVGCFTLKADELAKEIIFSENSEVKEKIINEFGPDLIDQVSDLNKEVFARILFSDIEKRSYVNSIVHPLVAKERKRIIRDTEKSKSYDYFVYESALMVESGIHNQFDILVVVYTTKQDQILRLMRRDDIGHSEVESRIKAQFPLAEKLKLADYTIDSSGSLDDTRIKTFETFSLIKKHGT